MSVELQDTLKFSNSDGNDFVDSDSFKNLCKQLNISESDADLIFDDLDLDRDGKISFSDFSKGFSNFLLASNITDESFPEDDVKKRVLSMIKEETGKQFYEMNDEVRLQWLLNEMQSSEQRHLVPVLEGAVGELMVSLKKLQEEKSKMEESLKMEKQKHQYHLQKIEDEMDSQVKEVEMDMRIKAQGVVEDKRKSLQSRVDTELNKVADIEKVFNWFHTQNPPDVFRDSRLKDLRSKLNEAVSDNHQLRMSLLDTQTSIALMRNELLQLRSLYEEKCRELASEKGKNLEVLQEQDHLSRQLNLLHDANRRLLDFHDALKVSVDLSSRQDNFNCMSRVKNGSIIGDYLDMNYSPQFLDKCTEMEDLEYVVDPQESSIMRRTKSADTINTTIMRRSKETESTTGLPSLNQSDSGVSSNVRDSFGQTDLWEEDPSKSFVEEDFEEGSTRTNPRKTSMNYKPSEMSEDKKDQDSFPKRSISDIKKQLGFKDEPKANFQRNWAHHYCSSPNVNFPGQSKVSPPNGKIKLSEVTRDQITTGQNWDPKPYPIEANESEFEPNGPPVQTFRVMLVGDAGVGKSSFALRISKGVFISDMSSTLGLDFLIRNIRVNNRNVAVQLWDTAGQERFRSVTKSYFRKADGVMLLYDCTSEQSFLNVRQWLKDIRDNSVQHIALMIVANKIDLQEMALKSGKTCVSTKQGEKLAKDYETIFIEASAKEGLNVLHALVNLIRSMTTEQDRHLSASTMQLNETKSMKKSCCGK